MAAPNQRRSIWWWIFCAPGAAILWLEYLFPRSVSASFGTARRKDVRILQFVQTILVYGLLALAVTHYQETKAIVGWLLSPLRDIWNLPSK